MTLEQPIFWEYAIFKDGELTGIKKDALKDAVDSYKEFLKELEQCEKEQVRL